MIRSKVALAGVIVGFVGLILGAVSVFASMSLMDTYSTPEISEDTLVSLVLGIAVVTGIFFFVSIILLLMGYLKNQKGFVIAALVLGISSLFYGGILVGGPYITLCSIAISKVSQCAELESMKSDDSQYVFN